MSYEKYEKDGKVAVLISPGYGGGWSTWAGANPSQVCMDKRFVELALGEREGTIEDLVKEVFDDKYAYTGGWYQIIVVWVDKGDRFKIDEYDGYESLNVLGPEYGMIA